MSYVLSFAYVGIIGISSIMRLTHTLIVSRFR